jgi:Arc/MetJ-type ribon-helix-helix transcriptional regulator
MTIAITNLPDDLQKFVDDALANGEYPDVEHLMLGALYQLKEQHLSEDEELEMDAAWGDELDKRIDEIKNGTVRTIPGAEVFARIDKLIAKHRNA